MKTKLHKWLQAHSVKRLFVTAAGLSKQSKGRVDAVCVVFAE